MSVVPRMLSGRVGRGTAIAALVAGTAFAPPGAPARASGPACPLGLVAHTVHPSGAPSFTMCSGRVPSFDGTPLDVDLSLPAGVRGPRPLIVMLHGWGSSKTDFEATGYAGNGANTWHWNNVWFADHGYPVLNYTARGFHQSCGKDPATGYSYATDPSCAGRASWTHLADRRWEIHDTQYLVGLLVDAGIAAPNKIVTTGDSYGGGQSWLLALGGSQILSPSGQTSPWRSPHGVPIRLAAAVPQFPWTDLAQALIDNGRASDGFFGAPPNGPHEQPIGVDKQTYVAGLFGLGVSTAQYAPPGVDPSADLTSWYAAISAGEPYAANPMVGYALNQLERYRSPFSLPVPPRALQVPVLDLQGVTDPLFPGIQAIELANRLYQANPHYPLWTLLGDLGHSYAANPHALWVRFNTTANDWLTAVLAGRHPDLPRYTAVSVGCLPGQPVQVASASSFPGLAGHAWQFSSTATATTSTATPPGPEAAAVDPIVNGTVPGTTSGCRIMPIQTDPGVAAWTFRPPSAGTLFGAPVVHVTAQLTGTDAILAARLWDLNPATGQQALITRSVFRLTGPAPGSVHQLAFELWPTAWALSPGHELKLELTQTDGPTWRLDNLPSTLTLSGLRLTVPARATAVR